MPNELNIHVRLEDSALWATVEEFPGVFATGDTPRELRESLQEGISLYLAEPGQEPRPVTLGELHYPEAAEIAASAQLIYA